MHRIDEDDVAGMWAETAPGTKITDDWMNDLQENICQFIEAQSITLVKGTYTQLTAAISAAITTALTALKAAANTWDLLQTFSKGATVNQATSNTNALTATGNGTGAGVVGSSTGAGSGGVFSSTSGNAVSIGAGHAKFTASNPAATDGFSNVQTPLNVVKAWARIQTNGAGGASIIDGFNVASVSISSGAIRATFATALADSNYAVIATPRFVNITLNAEPVSASQCQVSAFNPGAGSTYSFATNSNTVYLIVLGRQ